MILLKNRLKELGINSDIINSVNRFDNRVVKRLRIPYSEFNNVSIICKEHIIESKIYLIEYKNNLLLSFFLKSVLK